MGFPSKLKNFNLFLDGTSYAGVVSETTLPKLAIKTEEWRAGGMLGPMKIDLGLEAMEMEISFGGLVQQSIAQFGIAEHDGAQLRFAGAYQEDGSGTVQAAEIIVRGRYHAIDMGSAKVGGDTTHKATLNVSSYTLTVDGVTWVDIDLMNCIFVVNGVDRYAAIRAALGL